MLNFDRFKYRSKAPLDFLSPEKKRNDNALSPVKGLQQQGYSEESELGKTKQQIQAKPRPDTYVRSETNADCVAVNESKNANREKNFNRGSYSRDASQYLESTGTRGSNSFFVEKTKGTISKYPVRDDRGFIAANSYSKAKIFSSEERLKNLLSNGPKCSNLVLKEPDSSDEEPSSSRKRKQPHSHMDFFNDQQESVSFSNMSKKAPSHTERKSPSSYQCFKPKSKRKKVILLDEDGDEESTSSIPGDNVQRGTHAQSSLNRDLEEDTTNDDVEKLREIYSHLTISQAKEALDLAGTLMDAILNLSDTLFIEGKGKLEKNRKEESPMKRHKRSKKSRKIIIDDDADDDKAVTHDVKLEKAPHEINDSINCKEDAKNDDVNREDSNEDNYEMTVEETRLFSFFQEASVADIGTVPGVSERKASEIVKLKPFKDYEDLITRISTIKGVSMKTIQDSMDFINQQTEVDQLMDDCQKISARISKAITTLASIKEDDDLADLDFEDHSFISKQPAILNSSLELKHYQMTGLNWLVTLHKEEVNGILADQMGLGKTIQALAFIGYLIETGNPGPHVIIVPSSTCDNWLREIDTWLPTASYIHYKGTQEERFALREEILYGEDEFNIIIATYNIAISTPKDRSLFRRLKSQYLILDEAHMLKNMKSNRYRYLMDIKSSRRLLLTGTPLQNNLLELISLLSFLMPDLFADRINGITLLFGSKTQSSYQGRIIETAKHILKPFILRRTKNNVLKDLPQKIEKLVYCDLTQKQRMYYDVLVTKYKALDGSSVDYKSALTILMQLRKTSNHPLLDRNLYDEELLRRMALDYVHELENRESCFEKVLEDMEVMSDFELHSLCREKYYLNKYSLHVDAILNSGKFKQLDVLLPELKLKGSRVLLFSQFTMLLDIVEHYLKHRSHRYLRLDGQTPVAERQSLIDEYNENEEIFLFLLSTRAGGVGINLTSANVVIMHDIDFNPYNDKQAEDRCHRVGQKRDVTIYKLVAKETVEESILTCAKSKLNLEKNVAGNFEEDNSTSEDVVKFVMANIS